MNSVHKVKSRKLKVESIFSVNLFFVIPTLLEESLNYFSERSLRTFMHSVEMTAGFSSRFLSNNNISNSNPLTGVRG